MEDKKIKVSIGMPAYNEEAYIGLSLESLLNQDYTDFEIIIMDNASEDRTGEICKSYMEKDKRIRYFQNKENIGAIQNSALAFEKASGEFYLSAGAHDLWSPNYLGECVKLLEENPDMVLAHAPTIWIDENGQEMDIVSGSSHTQGTGPVGRFYFVVWSELNAAYGMMRRTALKHARFDRQMAGADLVGLIELALQGSFGVAYHAKWYRRENRIEETEKERLQRYQKLLFRPGTKKGRLFPYLRIPFAITGAILRSCLSFQDKLVLLLFGLPACIAKYLAKKANPSKHYA